MIRLQNRIISYLIQNIFLLFQFIEPTWTERVILIYNAYNVGYIIIVINNKMKFNNVSTLNYI